MMLNNEISDAVCDGSCNVQLSNRYAYSFNVSVSCSFFTW